jgi:Protein of unknown function (DUF4054)
MDLTYGSFIEDYEEFEDFSEALINRLIIVSESYFNDHIWGDKLNFIRGLYVAHCLQLKEISTTNNNNLVSSIDVKDELKVNFNQIDYQVEDYSLTYYGRILKNLIKQKSRSFVATVRPKGIYSNVK